MKTNRYDNFGGEYHCFLQLDTNLMYGIYVPMIIVTVITFAVIEAAGGASDYEKVKILVNNQFEESNKY